MKTQETLDRLSRQGKNRLRKACHARGRHPRRLRLEPLEDRRLLATYNVTTVLDPAPNGCNVGHCSLREAIIAANANGGADTINRNGDITFSPDKNLDVDLQTTIRRPASTESTWGRVRI